MNVFLLFTGAIIGYFLIALYHTFLKEKSLIEEGGEPLATSSYVFLAVKHVVWALVAWTGGIITPAHWFSGNTFLVLLAAVGYILLTHLVATVIEVSIRVLVIQIMIRRLKKKEQTENEGA